MKHLKISFLFLSISVTSAFSQNLKPDTIAKGVFILHKFQQAIGKESYSIVRKNDSLRLQSNFKFNDRGTDVPSQTVLVLNQSGVPVYFKTKGSTSRSSVADVEVFVKKDSVKVRSTKNFNRTRTPKTFFTIYGYSPIAIQMAVIKFWKQNGKPESLTIFPGGKLKIKFDGYDTIQHKLLERYFIKGLIWGSEIAWTQPNGDLVSLFTNDAEGDKFEAIAEAFKNTLPDFIGRAAKYGMADLKKNQSTEKYPSLALVNGNILDVVTGKIISGKTVIIEKGNIKSVEESSKTVLPKSAKVIDLKGKYILPGLWDMHAHFQQVEWGPAYLAAGVTTVRDCGNEFDFINATKKSIDNNEGVGPRILRAGIVDGDGRLALGIVRANTAAEAKAVVKKYKDNGYEQIKIYSSVKPEIIKAIAEEAHNVGLTVTGHIPQGVSLLEAINAGQDQVNHFTFVYQAMKSSKDQKKIDFKDATAQEVLNVLKEKKIVVDPTLGIYEWITRPIENPIDAFEPGVNYLTEDLKEIFRGTGMPTEKANDRKYLLESGKEIVKKLHDSGITIVAGTDMMVPGFSLLRELELYAQAGLTPLESIQTATIVPARVMKLENELGSVSVGKKADLVIIDGNPFENISNIRKITQVIKSGVAFEPSKLRELVDFKGEVK
ncbi:MAG TPA: amidohydrolase [Cytophagales bacterium]|nr:amidohydrolase [Cytophagales bacterium]